MSESPLALDSVLMPSVSSLCSSSIVSSSMPSSSQFCTDKFPGQPNNSVKDRSSQVKQVKLTINIMICENVFVQEQKPALQHRHINLSRRFTTHLHSFPPTAPLSQYHLHQNLRLEDLHRLKPCLHQRTLSGGTRQKPVIHKATVETLYRTTWQIYYIRETWIIPQKRGKDGQRNGTDQRGEGTKQKKKPLSLKFSWVKSTYSHLN